MKNLLLIEKWREIFDEFLKSGCGSGEGDILISSNAQHEKKSKNSVKCNCFTLRVILDTSCVRKTMNFVDLF